MHVDLDELDAAMAEWNAIRREFYADRDVLDAIENRADATSEFRQGSVTAGGRNAWWYQWVSAELKAMAT